MSYSIALIITYIEASFMALRPHEVVLWGAIYFSMLYFFFTSAVWCLAQFIHRPIETRPVKPTQIQTEILDSIRSILIFSIGLVVPWGMLHVGLTSFADTLSITSILTEILILIVWNDVHFYAMHRLLHSKLKKWHIAHHQSVTATPFAAYSMSIGEALLLGSVMPIAMLFHDFSIVSLAALPIWSITINAFAHSNCNLFPNASEHSLLELIKHHQSHHSRYHGNYSFFFTQLDRWFNTAQQ